MYRWLWRDLLGLRAPLTFYVRTLTPRYLALALLAAMAIGRFLWVRVGWKAWVAFLLGILFGHFFWT